ncbi:MAG: hypothetical protein A7315_12250 [Candidatus Altiarchaeales archaeon WOR_SM1_79]|nr:MAG: hypothetical protein A7315_12250 [Candidatus Altiarchaeales archaeon WOR_SM1_79]
MFVKYGGVRIAVKRGDITRLGIDGISAIVNPANSMGTMGGGVALAIMSAGGKEIEDEAIEKAPIPIGKAVPTTAGKLGVDFIIHSPTMKNAVEPSTEKRIRKATLAALECAAENGVERVAFPGMGTGVGRMPKDAAAKFMVDTIKKFIDSENRGVKEIFLVGSDELCKQFANALELMF